MALCWKLMMSQLSIMCSIHRHINAVKSIPIQMINISDRSHSSARYFLTLDWGRPASRNQAADPHDCSYSTEMTPPSIGEHRARSATQEVKVNRLELLPTSMRIYFLVTWNPFSGSGWRKVNWSRNRLLSRHVNSWIRFTVDWLLSGIKEKRIRKISLFEK